MRAGGCVGLMHYDDTTPECQDGDGLLVLDNQDDRGTGGNGLTPPRGAPRTRFPAAAAAASSFAYDGCQ
jgi:hypothetical protein